MAHTTGKQHQAQRAAAERGPPGAAAQICPPGHASSRQSSSIVVSQEYPNWTAFAEAQAKTAADPEFSAWLSDLDKIRTITSDSLYREL